MLGRPYKFSFDGPPPAPDWIVQGLIERGCVTMLSADAGVGKSLITDSIAVAIMHGEKWCGRKTTGQRCLFVDEENAPTVFDPRLQALGFNRADDQNMKYYTRLGVQLGTDDWFERLADEIDDFRPDFTVIDTVAAATSTLMNENDGIAKIFSGVLRPLAETTGLVVLHHHRKSQANQTRDLGQEMMGGRQWAGQADTHIALRKKSEVSERVTEGKLRRSYLIHLEKPKDRAGFTCHEDLEVLSEHERMDDETWNSQAKWLRVDRAKERRR